MKFKIKYDNLVAKLQEVSAVVEDQLTQEDSKNVVFKFEEGKATILGISATLTLKKPLKESEYTLELDEKDMITENIDGVEHQVVYMQLKSKELLNFLNAYKSLSLTVVDDVTFEFTPRGQVKCTVTEIDIPKDKESNSTEEGTILDMLEISEESEEAEKKPETTSSKVRKSWWVFDNIAIKANMKRFINMSVSEDVELTPFVGSQILWNTIHLLPVMQNTTNMFGKMAFDNDFVVAFNPMFTSLLGNVVSEGGILSGLNLSYKALTFLSKILTPETQLLVSKQGNQLYIKIEDESEIFITFDTAQIKYSQFFDIMKNATHKIVVNRVYLKDVLKRLSLSNDNVEFVTGEGKVTLKNTKFEQDIDIIASEDMESLGKISFKIMPDVLNKAIIGDSLNEHDEITIAFSEGKNGIMVVISHMEKKWASIVKVKTY